jgi:hypothetical protein
MAILARDLVIPGMKLVREGYGLCRFVGQINGARIENATQNNMSYSHNGHNGQDEECGKRERVLLRLLLQIHASSLKDIARRKSIAKKSR